MRCRCDCLPTTIRGYLDANEIEYEALSASSFSLTLPGEKKLQTPVRLDVGEHALGVHAFVCRNPDENHARVYRWLLERNLRMYAVAFAVDHAGDIYLDARLPLSSDHRRRARPAARLGARARRRVVQRDPRARLRQLDPQGVGVAASRGASRPPTSRRSAGGSSRDDAATRRSTSARPAPRPGRAPPAPPGRRGSCG